MGLFDIDPQLLQGLDFSNPQNPNFRQKLMGLLGSGYDDPQTQGLLGMSAALLKASGPSTTPTSLGQAFGQGLQGYQQGRESGLKQRNTLQELAQRGKLIDAQVSHLAQKTGPEGFTLGTGQTRFDAYGRPIASVGRDTSEIDTKKQAQAFDDASKLRGEFINQSKDFKQVRDSYERIYEAAQKPSAAGDLALIFNYMKMLDPGSTVREGEFANAQNAAGIPERVQAMYNNTLKGERLTENTRDDFLRRSDMMYEAQLRGQTQLEDAYRGIAGRYGLRPENIIVDYRVKAKRPGKQDVSTGAENKVITVDW